MRIYKKIVAVVAVVAELIAAYEYLQAACSGSLRPHTPVA
jgi:hypothetical protein